MIPVLAPQCQVEIAFGSRSGRHFRETEGQISVTAPTLHMRLGGEFNSSFQHCHLCMSEMPLLKTWVCLEGIKYYVAVNTAHGPGKMCLFLDNQRTHMVIFN